MQWDEARDDYLDDDDDSLCFVLFLFVRLNFKKRDLKFQSFFCFRLQWSDKEAASCWCITSGIIIRVVNRLYGLDWLNVCYM